MSVQTNLDLGAYRQAMLSVAPDRLEQFSQAMKQNITENKGKKKKKKTSSSSSERKHHKNESSSKSKKDSSSSSKDKKKRSKRKSSSQTPDNKIKKNKKTTEKKTHNNKEDDEDSICGDSDVEENGLDLNIPLHPLSHFVKNREVLMEEIFKIVRGPKLEQMLPDKLKKELDLVKLKQKCLAHLEVMSSKRLLHIINGEQMDSSSGTDSSDDEGGVKKVEKVEVKNKEDTLQTNVIDSTTPSTYIVPPPPAATTTKPVTSTTTTKTPPPAKPQVATNNDEIVSTSTATSKVLDKSIDEEVEEEEVAYFDEDDYANMVDTMLEETLPKDAKETPKVEEAPKVETPKPTPLEDEPLIEIDTTSNRNQLEYLEQQLRLRAIKSLMKSTKGVGKPSTEKAEGTKS